MKYARCAAISGAAMLCLAVGCSSGQSNDDDGAVTSTSASAATSAVTAEPDSLTIDVVIADGSVTPTNERVDGSVGEKVTVRVDSDAEDELHVHSVPDHSFDIAPTNGQTFEFTVEVPGQVALELHDADRTIATLVVRP
ncbi:hypothetical protein DK926_14360 [Rhodococcus sp. Eu-32]|uniref:hypothetical protein n=1 Tax=Rhodococcus sp. Eu-32 TaxID=1017319 RepID=UPI000DF3994C|nr:hypothetical protein [Rhodococcus sp. Eu-32]RRQ27289.1 hypothetical protein DK926_14360 [Rhodococcus sp. Eu-32]